MAWIDAARGLLVLRIVYDGPPMSGKTTSVTALGAGMTGTVHCPESRDGRTLYFDWLEYVGGLFEGHQIRCQIVSVPGQRELAARREHLLRSADSVVCVLDTSRDELEHGLQWLRDLSAVCRDRAPPVGIVLQANKRDVDDAVPRAELSSRFNAVAPVAIVEAIATASDGIREAFVFAVRLALDRVRAQAAEGGLSNQPSVEDDPRALLTAMRTQEAARPEPVVRPLLELGPEALAEQASAFAAEPAPSVCSLPEQGAELPFTPDPAMPGGMIWPPVDGRALLHEVAALGIHPRQTPRGDFWGAGAGWCFHSSRLDLFDEPTRAREALLRWARLHAAYSSHVSGGRAVILADAGSGRQRLWQLVRLESALRERLALVMAAATPRQVAQGLIEVAERLLSARQRFLQLGVNLPCTLWTIAGAEHAPPTFVGLMPNLGHEVSELGARALLEREISPQLRELRRVRADFGEIVRELRALCVAVANDATASELNAVLERVA